MGAYRVVREEDVITVLKLQNGRWVVATRLRPEDIVQVAPKVFKTAKELNDHALVYHIFGGEHE